MSLAVTGLGVIVLYKAITVTKRENTELAKTAKEKKDQEVSNSNVIP
jgi:hypothetical protein